MAAIPCSMFTASKVHESLLDERAGGRTAPCERIPHQYNSKLMNSIWGLYNQHAPPAFQKNNEQWAASNTGAPSHQNRLVCGWLRAETEKSSRFHGRAFMNFHAHTSFASSLAYSQERHPDWRFFSEWRGAPALRYVYTRRHTSISWLQRENCPPFHLLAVMIQIPFSSHLLFYYTCTHT